MLKGIPSCISPDLLKILMEMGHGDEIVIADGNFPSASNAARLVRADGLGVLDILKGISQLMPLDTFVEYPATLMGVVPGDNYTPALWPQYKEVLAADNPHFKGFETIDRQAFYERSRKAYAIIATGETSRYANIIIKKGII